MLKCGGSTATFLHIRSKANADQVLASQRQYHNSSGILEELETFAAWIFTRFGQPAA